MDDNFILEKYVMKALGTYDSKAVPRENLIYCRCPVCKDSKSNKVKKRGYFLKGSRKHNHWTYICFNGECDAEAGISVEILLKEHFPGIYSEYRKEMYLGNYFNEELKQTKQKKYVEKEKKEEDDVKFFIPILKGSGEIFELAKAECIKRKIPESVWDKFFVATGGVFQGRMIIPFYNLEGKIYYYQGRTLIGSDPKYLNRRFGEKEIAGIFHIDRNLPVLVVEGYIDHLFLENSIAIQGLKFTEKVKKEIVGLNCYYLLDNDKDGRKNCLKLLQKEMYVFNWKKFLKELNMENEKIKDVNDLCIKLNKDKFTFKELEQYFTNDILESGWFK